MLPKVCLLKIILFIQGLMWFCKKIQDHLFYFCEKCHWNFDRDCIEYVDCFGLYRYFWCVLLGIWFSHDKQNVH